jgi:hypothetical protein
MAAMKALTSERNVLRPKARGPTGHRLEPEAHMPSLSAAYTCLQTSRDSGSEAHELSLSDLSRGYGYTAPGGSNAVIAVPRVMIGGATGVPPAGYQIVGTENQPDGIPQSGR